MTLSPHVQPSLISEGNFSLTTPLFEELCLHHHPFHFKKVFESKSFHIPQQLSFHLRQLYAVLHI